MPENQQIRGQLQDLVATLDSKANPADVLAECRRLAMQVWMVWGRWFWCEAGVDSVGQVWTAWGSVDRQGLVDTADAFLGLPCR